jgi:glycerol-3-phosphate dehydrogenase
MVQIQTEVLVIGGGATGTGTVRDLAMRDFKTILLEKGDLTQGTTGRYHGLLHSGGRYVVKDPQAAKECIEENWVLRKIMPHCIEDTGGFFVVTPWDAADYAPRFLAGCKTSKIPVEELSVNQMLREEPILNPRITRCFRVPDASADSFLAADANAESARQYGAQILNYHKVIKLIRVQDRVIGIVCQDLVHNEEVHILADLVVNASGAWAGHLASLAGLNVSVIPGKGTMLAMNHRIVNTIINRCKMPADGDILVPTHTVSVIGTTDVKVEDPDHFAIEPWEVELMLEEGEKLVPGFKDMRVLRAWAGVRPLYQETNFEDTRDVTRAFVLLDHEKRDGVRDFITITGGKWTTYRKMAEVTVDLVCKKLGRSRPCRTHLETLPLPPYIANKSGRLRFYQSGERLKEIEEQRTYGELICECELATVDEVSHAIIQEHVRTIEDIRRDVRLGMGPCQGGFCTYRATGLLHRLRKLPVLETNLALHDFLQERWKGVLPILWGQQLRQERLNELIYISLFNSDHLPGPQSGTLSPVLYEKPKSQPSSEMNINSVNKQITPEKSASPKETLNTEKDNATQTPYLDLLVIGAGLSGLTTAWQAAKRGQHIRLISKGWGTLYWHTGCIDVLGYEPGDNFKLVDSPAESLSRLIQSSPDHPYAYLGVKIIDQALNTFKELYSSAGYNLQGSLEQNWFLPSGVGASRPTCLAPEMMIAGDLRKNDPMLVVGFDGYYDFFPELIADNLAAQGIPAEGINLSLPALLKRGFITGRVLAEMFDQLDLCEIVANEIKKVFQGKPPNKTLRIAFPAVLGLEQPKQVKEHLENLLGTPVFEIPTLPPSIPGIRLSRILVSAIERAGGHVYEGMQVSSAMMDSNRVFEIQTEAASRKKTHRAKNFALATGGFLGGGLHTDYLGRVAETVCQLPTLVPINRSEWFAQKFLSASGHPIFQTGITVNEKLQPIGVSGKKIYENLFIVGNLLSGGDYLQERSRDGVALVTGYSLGNRFG